MRKFTAWRKSFHQQFATRHFRFAPIRQVQSCLLTSPVLQAYTALCCSKEWRDDWKGIKFSRLYVLLREQFAHPDDPWCAETLKWWNEYVFFWSVSSHSRAYTSLGKFLAVLLIRTKNVRRQSRIHRDHPCVLAWITSGSGGSKQPRRSKTFLFAYLKKIHSCFAICKLHMFRMPKSDPHLLS